MEKYYVTSISKMSFCIVSLNSSNFCAKWYTPSLSNCQSATLFKQKKTRRRFGI